MSAWIGGVRCRRTSPLHALREFVLIQVCVWAGRGMYTCESLLHGWMGALLSPWFGPCRLCLAGVVSAWESMKWRIPIGYDSLYFHAKDNSWLPLSSRLLCHSLMSDDCPDSPLLHSGCEYAEVGAALGRGVKRAAVPLKHTDRRKSRQSHQSSMVRYRY